MEETDKGVFSPLIGANVYWLGTTVGASTDTNGVFHIPDAEGNYAFRKQMLLSELPLNNIGVVVGVLEHSSSFLQYL